MSHEEIKEGAVSHEKMACDLLGAAATIDTSDEWGQRRKSELTLEAVGHGILALTSAVHRATEAMQALGQARGPSDG